MRLTGLFAGMTAVAVSAAAAQAPNMKATQAGWEAFEKGEYLKADLALKAAALNRDGSIRDEAAFQSWNQIHPTLTGEVPVGGLRPAGKIKSELDPADLKALAAAQPHDAITEILRRAAATRVVILNEAHDSPRDRAFALEVARALRPLGYGYLAAETFAQPFEKGQKLIPVERLAHDHIVRRGSGTYTQDPVFAGFVREALGLGFQPIAYEQTIEQAGTATNRADSIATREEAEARNLETALRAHPGSRMLVYVGYSHVAEAVVAGNDASDEWMAARLKRKTGIDPLTIDQTSLTDTSRSQAALYDAAAARIERSSVFFAGDNPLVLGGLAGAVDLQVVHPRRTYRYGRPAWLKSLGGHPTAIPANLLPAKGVRLVQAFAADAPADAVPLDQVLVEAGKPVPMLMVPAGKLRFAVQDAD